MARETPRAASEPSTSTTALVERSREDGPPPLADQAALAACLAAGGIAGAGLDVSGTEPLPPESPPWGLPNAIITPHVGGISDISIGQALPAVAKHLLAFREGGVAALRNRVTRG